MEQPSQPDRTESARMHDDRDIIEAQEGAPGGANTAGNRVAKDVGTRDDMRRALSPDDSRTSATKSNEVQPATSSRSDHQGAQR